MHDKDGHEITIDKKLATQINQSLIMNHYVDDNNSLSQVYYEEKDKNELVFNDSCKEYKDDIIKILEKVYNPKSLNIENARDYVELHIDKKKFESKEFKELWKKINGKTVFRVKFDSKELIEKAIKSINSNLKIKTLYYKIVRGEQKEDMSIKDLDEKKAFETVSNVLRI